MLLPYHSHAHTNFCSLRHRLSAHQPQIAARSPQQAATNTCPSSLACCCSCHRRLSLPPPPLSPPLSQFAASCHQHLPLHPCLLLVLPPPSQVAATSPHPTAVSACRQLPSAHRHLRLPPAPLSKLPPTPAPPPLPAAGVATAVSGRRHLPSPHRQLPSASCHHLWPFLPCLLRRLPPLSQLAATSPQLAATSPQLDAYSARHHHPSANSKPRPVLPVLPMYAVWTTVQLHPLTR
ncbi:hypothetical protein PCANC_20286 [Puccinia coronata f. sp. avenae]|uniref:Uncharacterized protein n=1 Tax=Puccinia coronata f. sp. avenae TaxID=200324 RepID=A0A2N5UMK0_9BASI|nr:hypothetical protein PCANC_20286 [Puccinia coronata f. sp. avenae]